MGKIYNFPNLGIIYFLPCSDQFLDPFVFVVYWNILHQSIRIMLLLHLSSYVEA